MAKHTELRELQAIHDSRKSFYGKAHVKIEQDNGVTGYTLYSYDTFIIKIAEMDDNMHIMDITENPSHLTQTTLRHLKEFTLQLGLEPNTKREWLEYMEA